MKPEPAHGTPSRYKGTANREPCRCSTCVSGYQAARFTERFRKAEREATGESMGGRVGPKGPSQAPPNMPPTIVGPVEQAVTADIAAASAQGTGLAALALALAREIDASFHLVSIAGAARQLRDCLADLRKDGRGTGDDAIDSLIAELQSGPAPLPAALLDTETP